MGFDVFHYLKRGADGEIGLKPIASKNKANISKNKKQT